MLQKDHWPHSSFTLQITVQRFVKNSVRDAQLETFPKKSESNGPKSMTVKSKSTKIKPPRIKPNMKKNWKPTTQVCFLFVPLEDLHVPDCLEKYNNFFSRCKTIQSKWKRWLRWLLKIRILFFSLQFSLPRPFELLAICLVFPKKYRTYCLSSKSHLAPVILV